jgi:hypothetical protein
MVTRRSTLKSLLAAGVAGLGIRKGTHGTAGEFEVQDFGVFYGPMIAGTLRRGMTLSARMQSRGLAVSVHGLHLGFVGTRVAPARVFVSRLETDEFNRHRLFVRMAHSSAYARDTP